MKPLKQPTVQEQIDREIHRRDGYLEIVLGYTVSEETGRKILEELRKVAKTMQGK